MIDKMILNSCLLAITMLALCSSVLAEAITKEQHEQARWHPLHFKPQIDTATDKQCLACHQEVLDRKVFDQSPAGIKASASLAWYQTLNTYKGLQETFHRRHLVTPLAKRVMALRCNTCHQGHDPREEAPVPPDQANTNFTLRKTVNPDTCLMCHGANNYKIMGLPGPWIEFSETFQNNCLLCHAGIRTNRHQVNFLKPDAIEKEGAKDSDVCFGCHGGRAWYRIAYPYPRHTWQGMAPDVPEWAKDRPTESQPRFRIKDTKTARTTVTLGGK